MLISPLLMEHTLMKLYLVLPENNTYSLSFDGTDGKMLLKVAMVRAALFNTVLQHISMKARTASPLFTPEKAYEERSSKSFSSLPLFISVNSMARLVEDSPSLPNKEAASPSSREVT